ncbi:MAG: respiratory nitrate reductase subunit gamma, partial [Ilumatobacteraceae bacterium]
METKPSNTPQSSRRVKPYQVSIILGVGIGVFTMISGIIPQLTNWESDSPVQRTVFGGIPGALQVVFYTVIPMLLIWGSIRFSDRIRNWERGAPDQRKTTRKNIKRRLADYRAGVYMRTLLRDSAAGLMHSMMYFGFLALLGVTTVLEIDHQMPPALKFLHGDVYRGYAMVGDLAGAVFVGGVVWAILRRYIQRPYRIRIKTRPEHALILGVLLAIGVSGFGAEAFRIAESQASGLSLEYEKWSIVGYPLAQLVNSTSSSTLATWHQAWWVAHVLAFVVFLAILPITMLRHMFTSPLNMYLK